MSGRERHTGGCRRGTDFSPSARCTVLFMPGQSSPYPKPSVEAAQRSQRRFDPLLASGMVTQVHPNVTQQDFLGSCAAFRRPHVVLAASHCVPHNVSLAVWFPNRSEHRAVRRVERHPTADLAVLICETQMNDEVTHIPHNAFWEPARSHTLTLGRDFMAHGYPPEAPWENPDDQRPAARLFRGHYQRFFTKKTPSGYSYLAGEMSIPAPAGLSGGPAFGIQGDFYLDGIVTANHETYSLLDSTEEIETGGNVTRVESRRVIAYGITLVLYPLLTWLDSLIPRVSR
jgi:hypothetical protein